MQVTSYLGPVVGSNDYSIDCDVTVGQPAQPGGLSPKATDTQWPHDQLSQVDYHQELPIHNGLMVTRE